MCESLTMPARASSVVWTCVMFPFSNRSFASNMSFGFRPYARMALMKLPRFSSYANRKRGFGAMPLHIPTHNCLPKTLANLEHVKNDSKSEIPHLMPVEFGVVNFPHRARLKLVDQPVNNKNSKSFTCSLIFRNCLDHGQGHSGPGAHSRNTWHKVGMYPGCAFTLRGNFE